MHLFYNLGSSNVLKDPSALNLTPVPSGALTSSPPRCKFLKTDFGFFNMLSITCCAILFCCAMLPSNLGNVPLILCPEACLVSALPAAVNPSLLICSDAALDNSDISTLEESWVSLKSADD